MNHHQTLGIKGHQLLANMGLWALRRGAQGLQLLEFDLPLKYPPVSSNMAMENGPLKGDCPIKTSIHRGFSIAMFNYRRVPLKYWNKLSKWKQDWWKWNCRDPHCHDHLPHSHVGDLQCLAMQIAQSHSSAALWQIWTPSSCMKDLRNTSWLQKSIFPPNNVS